MGSRGGDVPKAGRAPVTELRALALSCSDQSKLPWSVVPGLPAGTLVRKFLMACVLKLMRLAKGVDGLLRSSSSKALSSIDSGLELVDMLLRRKMKVLPGDPVRPSEADTETRRRWCDSPLPAMAVAVAGEVKMGGGAVVAARELRR